MSKRIDAYRKGLERFFQFTELYLAQGTIPPPEDIDAELKSIDALRSIEYAVMVPERPIENKAGFIALIGEEYTRYDDALPSLLRICFLPDELDAPKEINRRMTMMPIE
jgi:hypothetical protein